MQVVRPPCDDRDVAGGEVPREAVDVADELEPSWRRQRAGSMRGPQTTIMRRSGTRRRAAAGLDHAPQQAVADARSADGDEADRSSGAVAELGAQRLAVGRLAGVGGEHVAGEVEVLLHPRPDRRQPVAEAVRHDVVGRPPTKIARSRTRGKRAICSIISAL